MYRCLFDPDAKDDAPTAPVQPERPKPVGLATEVDKAVAEDHVYNSRKFERQEKALDLD